MNAGEEERKIAALKYELERAYPRVPREKIKNAVEQSWTSHRDDAVRHFVPLLVQREVTSWLREPDAATSEAMRKSPGVP